MPGLRKRGPAHAKGFPGFGVRAGNAGNRYVSPELPRNRGSVPRFSLEEWAKKELDRAKALETQNPAQAEKAYKNLATRFAGLEAATSARERLQDKAFQDDLRSWALVERIQAAEKRLKDVPGSERSAKDPKFARMNSLTLGQIKTAAQGLAQQGARPWILDEANGVLERCGLEKIEKPAAPAGL